MPISYSDILRGIIGRDILDDLRGDFGNENPDSFDLWTRLLGDLTEANGIVASLDRPRKLVDFTSFFCMIVELLR